MGAYVENDDVAWGDAEIASHFHKKEESLKLKFSSLMEAYIMASAAASEMAVGLKGSPLYLEAEKNFNEAMAYIKKFKRRK